MVAGLVNFLAGFLGLFPGLFEVAASDPELEQGSIGVAELLGTPYGRYALAHLGSAGIQILSGSWLSLLTQGPLIHSVLFLCALCLGLEIWGWVLKGALSLWAVPGTVAAALTGLLYGMEIRRRRLASR